MNASTAATRPPAPLAEAVNADVLTPDAAALWPELNWYHWLGDAVDPPPKPVDTVRARFGSSLPGYSVFGDEPESFSEWLRLLPLAAPGTPVKNHRDEIVVPGDDEHLAAVIAIDIGAWQKSSDVVLRLHAEWRWFTGDLRMLYLADSGYELPLQNWQNGERLVSTANLPQWARQAAPLAKLHHADFRAYLESVFAWSGTQALLAESTPLAPDRLEPGAFFLRPHQPTEVLVVLDVATSKTGKRAMLLARAGNPAESVQVIRPNRETAWFPVRPEQPLRISRAQAFQWKDLRGLKTLRSPPEIACRGSMCPPTRSPGQDTGK